MDCLTIYSYVTHQISETYKNEIVVGIEKEFRKKSGGKSQGGKNGKENRNKKRRKQNKTKQNRK